MTVPVGDIIPGLSQRASKPPEVSRQYNPTGIWITRGPLWDILGRFGMGWASWGWQWNTSWSLSGSSTVERLW